jgi:hypothetical protein
LAIAVLAGVEKSAHAAAFTAGDVVVYRVGAGSATLASVATAVYLDEYTTTGTLVQSIALSSGTTPFTASGTAGSEGLLTLSNNGQYLAVPGYDVATGTTGVASTTTTSGTNLREVVGLDATGTVTSTTLLNAFSGNNIRSAVISDDGSTVYASGATTGIVSAATNSTSTTAASIVSSTSTNNRAIGISNGALFFSTGSGSTRGVYSVPSLTGTGQTATSVATDTYGSTTAAASSPYGFTFATETPGATAPDTLYMIDSTNVLVKYSVSGGTYTPEGSLTLTGLASGTTTTGVTGMYVTGVGEELFVTTGGTGAPGGGGLYSVVDSLGSLGALSGSTTATLLAAAATDESFRGVAFAPTAAPEPTSLLLLGTTVLPLLGRRRRAGI